MNIKYNPIISFAFLLLIIFSINHLRVELYNLDKTIYLMKAIFHIVILSFSVYALMITLRKYHIVVDENKFTIRDRIVDKEKIIDMSSIHSINWTTQKEGIWLRGRKLFVIALKNNQRLKFHSLTWLSKKTRNKLFKRLEQSGIIVQGN